jgi:hypothetical protein
MPNCPCAALTDGVLWGVDRSTFRSLVVQSMEERRQRHEAALSSMPILQHLTPSQLAAVADCLHQETFEVRQWWWLCVTLCVVMVTGLHLELVDASGPVHACMHACVLLWQTLGRPCS